MGKKESLQTTPRLVKEVPSNEYKEEIRDGKKVYVKKSEKPIPKEPIPVKPKPTNYKPSGTPRKFPPPKPKSVEPDFVNEEDVVYLDEPTPKETVLKSSVQTYGNKLPRRDANQTFDTFEFASPSGNTTNDAIRANFEGNKHIIFDDKGNKIYTGKTLEDFRNNSIQQIETPMMSGVNKPNPNKIQEFSEQGITFDKNASGGIGVNKSTLGTNLKGATDTYVPKRYDSLGKEIITPNTGLKPLGTGALNTKEVGKMYDTEKPIEIKGKFAKGGLVGKIKGYYDGGGVYKPNMNIDGSYGNQNSSYKPLENTDINSGVVGQNDQYAAKNDMEAQKAKDEEKKKLNQQNARNVANKVGEGMGGIGSAYYNSQTSQNEGEATRNAGLAATSQMGGIGGMIGGLAALGDKIGKPIKNRSQQVDANGELLDEGKAKRNAAIGITFSPSKRLSYEGGLTDITGQKYLDSIENKTRKQLKEVKDANQMSRQQQAILARNNNDQNATITNPYDLSGATFDENQNLVLANGQQFDANRSMKKGGIVSKIQMYADGGKVKKEMPKLKPIDFKKAKENYEEQTRGANQMDGSGVSAAEMAYRAARLADPTPITNASEIVKDAFMGNKQSVLNAMGLIPIPYTKAGMKAMSKLSQQFNKLNIFGHALDKTSDVVEEFANGGKIEGKGGPKDDKIIAKVKADSFVVPAKNAEVAEELREKLLMKAPKVKANLNQKGGEKVKLSNGEHLFTPEEKEELMEKGVNVNLLAPNAEHKEESMEKKSHIMFPRFAEGGGVPATKEEIAMNKKWFDDYETAIAKVEMQGNLLGNQNNYNRSNIMMNYKMSNVPDHIKYSTENTAKLNDAIKFYESKHPQGYALGGEISSEDEVDPIKELARLNKEKENAIKAGKVESDAAKAARDKEIADFNAKVESYDRKADRKSKIASWEKKYNDSKTKLDALNKSYEEASKSFEVANTPTAAQKAKGIKAGALTESQRQYKESLLKKIQEAKSELDNADRTYKYVKDDNNYDASGNIKVKPKTATVAPKAETKPTVVTENVAPTKPSLKAPKVSVPNTSKFVAPTVVDNGEDVIVPGDKLSPNERAIANADAEKATVQAAALNKSLPQTVATNGTPQNQRRGLADVIGNVDPTAFVGIGQAALGLNMLGKEKRPIDKAVIDPTYNTAVNRAQQDALFGLTPEQKFMAEQDIQGGLNDAKMAGLNASGVQSFNLNRAAINDAWKNKLGLKQADTEMRMNKQKYADSMAADRANILSANRRQAFNDAMYTFQQKQQAGSELIGAGLANTIGAYRYNKELEAQKEANLAGNAWTRQYGQTNV